MENRSIAASSAAAQASANTGNGRLIAGCVEALLSANTITKNNNAMLVIPTSARFKAALYLELALQGDETISFT